MLIFVILVIIFLACGGGRKSQEGIYIILFEPNPVALVGSVCSSTAKIAGDSEQNVTLVTSKIIITDSTDSANEASYMDNDLEAVFGAIYLPKAGYLEGNFSIDGEARGMPGEYRVTYFIVGAASNGYPRNYIGYLECVN